VEQKITIRQCVDIRDELVKLLQESEYKNHLEAEIKRFSLSTDNYLSNVKKLYETRIGLCGASLISEELEQKPLKAFKEVISSDMDSLKDIIAMTKEVRERKIGGEELLNWFKEGNKKNIKDCLELTESRLDLFKRVTFAELLDKLKMRSPVRYMQ
jgi:hypothetical protein